MPSFFKDSVSLNAADLQKFLAVHGKKGVKTLSLLGKYQFFHEAMQSTVGQQILNDVIVQMEKLLDRIMEMKATDYEVMEYKTLKGLLLSWSERIAIFERAKKKIKEG